MKSSTGKYFIGLDHIRAFAAFTVFAWHFVHVNNGHYAPPPAFPLSIFTEGHTGVSLFMVLSGFLFAKLLDGKTIDYRQFLWNRFLRLAPLLFLVILAIGLKRYFTGQDVLPYAKSILEGVLKPSLPNGGWSITAEFHFYLLLPLLLFASKKKQYFLPLFLLAMIGTRLLIYLESGQIQMLSYWTIVGRIDQFVLGILAFQFRQKVINKHILVLLCLILFAVFFWYFDSMGGFYKNPSYPSPSPIWIYLPTIEGLAYAILVAWYDGSFEHRLDGISRFVAQIGTYSYSIYLLHFFVVFRMANIVDARLLDLSNIHVAMAFSIIGFLIMVPIGYLSYRFIEMPFLRFRTKYIINNTR